MPVNHSRHMQENYRKRSVWCLEAQSFLLTGGLSHAVDRSSFISLISHHRFDLPSGSDQSEIEERRTKEEKRTKTQPDQRRENMVSQSDCGWS